MSSETAPKPSIVMLEDAVRRLGLRTGNLHLQIIDKNIAQTAREIFFGKNPLEKYLEITTPFFHEEVEKTRNEVFLKLSFTKNLSQEHPLTLPNIQKLMLFRIRLLKQGSLDFRVRESNRKILTIPLKDGFTTLAARMIINQLVNYNKSSSDPRENFRQYGYLSSKTY